MHNIPYAQCTQCNCQNEGQQYIQLQTINFSNLEVSVQTKFTFYDMYFIHFCFWFGLIMLYNFPLSKFLGDAEVNGSYGDRASRPTQGKKLNLPHATQLCKDVYYSIYTLFIWGIWKNTHLYTIVQHGVNFTFCPGQVFHPFCYL